MGNFLQTKEGEQAGLGGQSSLYNLITGERWVLYKSNKDPRGRIWHKVNKEGEIVDVKKGALNIGGNVAEWTKGGMGNTVNFAKDLPRNLLYHDLPRPKSKNKLKVNNNQVNPSTSFSDIYGREDLVRLSGKTSKTNNKGFMTRLSESFSDPSEIEPTGNKAVDEFFGYTGKPTNKSTKTPHRSHKLTKKEKAWLKANPSGTFINEAGVDEAYSPDFDILRAKQRTAHEAWLKDHGRI